jgi:hypothetical protein
MVNNGNNSIVLDHLAGLPRGIYFLQVSSGNTTYSEKLLKN